MLKMSLENFNKFEQFYLVSSGRASKNINNPPEGKAKDSKSKRSSSANSNNDPKERNANSVS
jgi:hypothetical protein